MAPLASAIGHHQLVLLLEPAVAGGGAHATLERERGVGDLPAVVHAADDVVLRATGVGEEHLAELGRAVGLHDAAHLDARLAHRDEQVADALVLRRVRVGAGEQEAVVGVVAAGGPHLLAVDDPLVAVEHGLGLERGEVGAAVGLAEALAPAHRAVQDLREELLLLLLGAPLQDGGADERVAEEVGAQRRLGPGELLGEHDALHRGEALAAVLLRPRGADPATLEELRGPALVERLALLGRHLQRLAALGGVDPAGGEVLLQPRADLGTERLGVGGVAQVHVTSIDPRVKSAEIVRR
jgi:hypothetical protein